MKKMMVFGSLFLVSISAMAGQLTQNTQKLELMSAKINEMAQQVEYGNGGAREQRQFKMRLQKLIEQAQIVKGLLSGQPTPVPVPSPLPPTQSIIYTAKCHIDDDMSLDFNQNVVDVQGGSIGFLIDDCQMMANAMYPYKNSFGIKDIKIQGAVPYGIQTAVCHIDDDPNMTFNQIVVGTIMGQTVKDIIKDCKALASSAYMTQGSSGISDLNNNNHVPSNAVSGVCHIDDDQDMTFNQFVPGLVFGHSISQISKDCRDLAQDTFGISSASGLKNIKR